ncbi:MAG TPA: hypothetical protein VII63_13320 [Caulobacteraceae bacterium]
MRDDLLGAQASVDWAVSNFPALQTRLDRWRDDNFEMVVKNAPGNDAENLLVAQEKEPLPFAVAVEAGAYVNAIRSSLDILATALAHRHRMAIRDEDIYFPIVASEAVFTDGKYKGSKFVQGLPAPERRLVELLKPYQGGNPLLWSLHHLDILRKHFRLLAVDANPASFHITGLGLKDHFRRVGTGWVEGAPGETVVGFLTKNAPRFQMKFTGYVGLNEPGPLARDPLVSALDKLASLANSIIKLFDTP